MHKSAEDSNVRKNRGPAVDKLTDCKLHFDDDRRRRKGEAGTKRKTRRLNKVGADENCGLAQHCGRGPQGMTRLGVQSRIVCSEINVVACRVPSTPVQTTLTSSVTIE